MAKFFLLWLTRATRALCLWQTVIPLFPFFSSIFYFISPSPSSSFTSFALFILFVRSHTVTRVGLNHNNSEWVRERKVCKKSWVHFLPYTHISATKYPFVVQSLSRLIVNLWYFIYLLCTHSHSFGLLFSLLFFHLHFAHRERERERESWMWMNERVNEWKSVQLFGPTFWQPSSGTRRSSINPSVRPIHPSVNFGQVVLFYSHLELNDCERENNGSVSITHFAFSFLLSLSLSFPFPFPLHLSLLVTGYSGTSMSVIFNWKCN